MNNPRDIRRDTTDSLLNAGVPKRGLAWVEEEDWLVFDDGTAGHYDINLEQFTDPSRTTEWFEHLEGKRWFSAEHKRQALEILRRKFHDRDVRT